MSSPLIISPLKLSLRYFVFLTLVAFTFTSPSRAESAGPVTPPIHTTEQKALLRALDDQLARFEALLARDENTSHAASVRTVFEALKRRRDAFNQAVFDQAKYDELRFDLNVAYQRLNLWLAPPLTPKAAPKANAAESTQRDQAGK